MVIRYAIGGSGGGVRDVVIILTSSASKASNAAIGMMIFWIVRLHCWKQG